MLMKILINPAYKRLREYVARIPETFETTGTVIHSGRNVVKTMTVDGLEINVKRYAIPPFINKIAYSLVRLSKGERAFYYAERLLKKGFDTPKPIAYIEDKQGRLFAHSYFVSTQLDYPQNFRQFGNADINDCQEVVKSFARFTARLHEADIRHLDYSPGNILFDRSPDGEYRFALVDINRMNFGKVNMRKGCANLARLWGQTPFFIVLAGEYARARGLNEEECIRLTLHYRKKFWTRFRRRHQVRYQLDI
jgi:serine/threonine protein kinase